VWAHNGMLRLSGEKMSKSLGNIDRLVDVLDRWGAETLLVFFAQGHYAAPLDFSDETMRQAQAASETLRNRLRDGSGGEDADLRAAVAQALDDDFNTPRALAHLFDAPPEASGTVAEVLDVLGLGVLGREDEAPVELVEKARRRDEARQARDFATADALRDEIEQAGWEARDTAAGTALYRRHDTG